MIDLRAHALALAAVFAAFAIGLLVGAARGGPVLARWQAAAAVQIERQFATTQTELASERATLSLLRAEQSSEQAFAQAALPWLVAGRLKGVDVTLYTDAPSLGRQTADAMAMAGAGVKTRSLSGPVAAVGRAVVVVDRLGEVGQATALAAGLQAAGVAVAGAEPQSAAPAADAAFTRLGLSFVDDVDDPAGEAALVFLLAGARGHFGREPTAAGPLPPP